MIHQTYIIEGIDRIGKDVLIDSIQQKLGFYQEIHFQKPKKLELYTKSKNNEWEFLYQQESFRNVMLLIKSGARLILNRSWIGENVYSNLYRGYSGNYIFELEKNMEIDYHDIKLILLYEFFQNSRHHFSDGNSFNDKNRKIEQELFFETFNNSIIKNKKAVCITGNDGYFRDKNLILEEVLI